MVERIRLGHKDGLHGLWVSPPGVDVATADRYLLSSAQSMLKIHAQGSYTSVATHNDTIFWQHQFERPYADLGYIPLAIIGVQPAGEGVQFPSTLNRFVKYHGGGVGNLMGLVGFKSDRLKVSGWHSSKTLTFYYTVFRYKILDSV